MDEAILDVVLQVRIAAHCSSIRPHQPCIFGRSAAQSGVRSVVTERRLSGKWFVQIDSIVQTSRREHKREYHATLHLIKKQLQSKVPIVITAMFS